MAFQAVVLVLLFLELGLVVSHALLEGLLILTHTHTHTAIAQQLLWAVSTQANVLR